MRCIVSNKEIEFHAMIADKVYYNIIDSSYFGKLGIHFDEDIYFKSFEFIHELKKAIEWMIHSPCTHLTAKHLEALINELLNKYRDMGLLFKSQELFESRGYCVLIHSENFDLLESLQ